MKRIVVHRPGGFERLCIEQCPALVPRPHEVLIEVEAIGVNYADCLARMGLYASARRYVGFPITPGFEVAGRVSTIGAKASGFETGEPVFALTRFNGYATQVAVDEALVFRVPSVLSMREAAAFPTVFLTAWYALYRLARPAPGASLLVHSAAGGVGSALVQLGKLAGCRVVGVVGGSHKAAVVREMGADEVIDKSSQDLWTIAEKAAPHGYDAIFDANGVATLRQSYRHLARMGSLVVYGFHTMLPKHRGTPNWLHLAWQYLRTPRFNPLELTTDNRSILAFNLSFLFDKTDLLGLAMGQLLDWVRAHHIKPPTITAYPFEEVRRAHRDLQSGATVGKLVLETSGPA